MKRKTRGCPIHGEIAHPILLVPTGSQLYQAFCPVLDCRRRLEVIEVDYNINPNLQICTYCKGEGYKPTYLLEETKTRGKLYTKYYNQCPSCSGEGLVPTGT